MAHPTLYLSYIDADIPLIDKFPVDKYEIDASSPISQFIRAKQLRGCFKVYTMGSGQPVMPGRQTNMSQYGDAFGFVKMVSNSIILHLLPYNFARLFQLLDDLIVSLKLIYTNQWRMEFEQYLLSLPFYYITPLKMGMLTIIALTRFV